MKRANRFAAFEFEVVLLSKLVIQVIGVEAKGGRSVIESDVQIGPELGDVEHLGLPDCQNREGRGREKKKKKKEKENNVIL